VRPNADEHAPEERRARLGQPADGCKSPARQQRIEHALALQNPFPDQRDHYRRQQYRVKKHPAPETSAHDLAVEHERGDERKGDHQSHLQQRELAGVVDGAPEQVLAASRRIEVALAIEQRLEIFEAGERAFRRIELHAARKREIEVDDDRQEGEEAEDRQVRGNEHPADARHAEPALHHAHRNVDRVHRRGGGSRRQLE